MHQIAAIVVFCWACVYACVAYLFKKETERLRKKINETERSCQDHLAIFVSGNLIEDMNKVLIIENFGIFEATVLISGALISALILAGIAIFVLRILGYPLFVLLAGLLLFLDRLGTMAYWYSGKIRKKPLKDLQKRDVAIMRYMLGILRSRQIRYLALSIIVVCSVLFVLVLLRLVEGG